MDLVRRDSLALEYRQSCVGKDALMRLPPRPILARHVAIVRGRCSPRDSVPVAVRPHAVKSAAAGQFPFEVVNAGEFYIRPRRLIMIPILIEPRYRIWTRSAVRRLMVLRNRGSAILRPGLSLCHCAQRCPCGGRDPELHPTPACDSKFLSHARLPFAKRSGPIV